MRKSLFLLFIFFSILQAEAAFPQIVNIQKNAENNIKNGINLGLYINIDSNFGNTQLFSFDAAFFSSFKFGNNLVLLLADGEYGFKNNLQDVNVSNTLTHLRYRYTFYEWFGIETFGQHEFDSFRRIATRLLAGTGPYFTPFSSDIFSFSIGSSYIFEYNKNTNEEEYIDSNLESFFHRWNNYIHFNVLLSDIVSFYTTFSIQPNVEDFNDYRMLLDSHIEVKITEYVTFNLSSLFSYDNMPPFGVEKIDYSLKLGFGFNYNFLQDKAN